MQICLHPDALGQAAKNSQGWMDYNICKRCYSLWDANVGVRELYKEIFMKEATF